MTDALLEQVTFAIGRAEGYVSKPVMRKRFKAVAEAALEAVRANLEGRLKYDEEGVLDMLRGERGLIE